MSGQDDPDRIIGSVTKNARKRIAVMLPTHKGRRFVDVRKRAADEGTALYAILSNGLLRYVKEAVRGAPK